MPWVIEDLIGTKNGVNKDFTVSNAPIQQSAIVIHHGNKLQKVAGTPQDEQFQFGLSGTAIKVGNAPESNEDLWTRYFYE